MLLQEKFNHRNIKRFAFLPIRMSDGIRVWLKSYYSLEFEWKREDYYLNKSSEWISIERSLNPIPND